ncbi:MAG TPA: flagellar hook-basal body complex protein [Roseimicrobium sp.]|nr:flagellar hook-basal body complex protein [Roseimicrobium sp.]
MLRGIYSAAGAMSLSMQKMNLFAENLSNSQTMGYKKKTYSIHSFQDMLVELPDETGTRRYSEKLPVATGSYIDGATVKQQQGRLQATGNPLDLAISGENIYLQLEVKKPTLKPGETQTHPEKTYTVTRDGNLQIDNENYLVNTSGDYVLDFKNNRIRLTADPALANQPPVKGKVLSSLDGSRLKIDQDGNIFDTLDKRVDAQGKPIPRARIKLVEWTDNKNNPMNFMTEKDLQAAPPPRNEMQAILKKYGLALPDDHELLDPSMDPAAQNRKMMETNPARRGMPKAFGPGDPIPMQASIKQGYLELSNVDITTEMINMMMTSKDYDMSQKLIAAEDKILDKTINEMGRLQ